MSVLSSAGTVMNIYLELTRKFNGGRVRAILAGGRAVVLHRLANEERLAKYMEASRPWAAVWVELARQMQDLDLLEAHRLMVQRAERQLPFVVPGGWP
jgi:hypothetical protein